MGCDDLAARTAFANAHNFNPRTRMGCDPALQIQILNDLISIHAPAWGATGILFVITTSGVFQSTHPHGVRHRAWEIKRQDVAFQSTHPHGVRLRQIFERYAKDGISIHAPAWGATI